MVFNLISEVGLILALIFSVSTFVIRWQRMTAIPLASDHSTPKDTAGRGIRYAFTMGMMPWAKESTRRHWMAYLRGIAFHLGIFSGLAVLLASAWLNQIPEWIRNLFAFATGFGAIMGFAGMIMRIGEKNLRAISTIDDHVSVWLVTVFLAAATWTLLLPAFLPGFWILSSLLLVYAPYSKIRHCIYFYFGRYFYGVHIGRRGIVKGLETSHV